MNLGSLPTPAQGSFPRKHSAQGLFPEEGRVPLGSLSLARAGICLCGPQTSGWGPWLAPSPFGHGALVWQGLAVLRDAITDYLRREAS